MSFSRVTFRAISAPLRGYHRSPDYKYQQIWSKRGVDFRDSLWERHCFYDSPKLVDRILRAMTVSKVHGNVPLLHAAPASMRVVMQCYEAIHGAPQEIPFKYLRHPAGSFAQRSLAEAEQEASNSSEEQKPGLLSMSYALGSSNKRLEGAADWGFGNHGGNQHYFRTTYLWEQFLKDVRVDPAAKAYFEAKGRDLIRKYNRLKVGDFYVLSVPAARVDRYVYDSKPYNIPTGKAASEVAADPTAHLDTFDANQTHMATMLLCSETLTPESGIAIVSANDADEVERFCGSVDFVSRDRIEEFSDYVSPWSTSFEESEEQARCQVNAELKQFAREFQHYLDTGQLVANLTVEEGSSSDYPADLP